MPDSHGHSTSDALRELLFRRDLAMTRHRAAVCRRLGIDETELRALMHLRRNGALTASRLAALLDLSSGGVAHLIRRLSDSRLVEQAPHPHDRRSRLLTLPTGLRDQLPQLLEPAQDAIDDAVRRDLPAHAALEAIARQSETTTQLDGGRPEREAANPARLVPSRWM
jgi:DNA-binding MarR family transcriptional regulator